MQPNEENSHPRHRTFCDYGDEYGFTIALEEKKGTPRVGQPLIIFLKPPALLVRINKAPPLPREPYALASGVVLRRCP